MSIGACYFPCCKITIPFDTLQEANEIVEIHNLWESMAYDWAEDR